MVEQKERVITIPYSRRDWAKTFDANEKRWNVLVLHRRSGKTTHMINKLIKKASSRPENIFADGVHAYIWPTYTQTKSIAWEATKYYASFIPWIKINESELKVTFPNKHILRLFGSDYPDSLRGLKYWDALFDEYQNQPANIFSEIIRPWLADTKWWATFIGTPKSKNVLREMLQKAYANIETWYSMILKASQSKLIDDEELKDIKETLTEEEYQQEFECSFDASQKWAYYAKELLTLYDSLDEEHPRIVTNLRDKKLPVYTFWDLGIGDYMAIIFVQLFRWEIRIIDYYENHWFGYDHYFKLLSDKWYTYKQHYFPHDIKVREQSTGVSRLQSMEDALWTEKCSVVKSMKVNDWINATRLIFHKFYFDEEKTQQLRQILSNYRQERDESKWIFKDNPEHDRSSHWADCARYMWITLKSIMEAWQNNTAVISEGNEWSDRSFGARPIEQKFRVEYKDGIKDEDDSMNFYVSWE